MKSLLSGLALIGAGLCAPLLPATFAQPVGAPLPPAIPAGRAVPYPGLLTLQVDATDVARHIYRVRETIPVAGPGPMTLSLPKWIPGEHAPTGPINLLAGLVISANGQRLAWVRDTVEMTAFHIVVPPGAEQIELELAQTAPGSGSFSGAAVTPEMLVLKWGGVSLVPAGYAVSGIRIQPSVRLPAGWRFASALDGAATTPQAGGDVTRFAPTTYETLVDSPLYAGSHMRRYDLAPGAPVPVHLNVFADDEAHLAATPAQLDAHRRLVQQATRLFGSQHYDHYDFLLTLDDEIGGVGIEHHRSSENGTGPRYFTDWDATAPDRDLLPHEYAHSWNGKFRRPADLWTPDYTTPMRDSLLWVYEGQTQFWGQVLAARSGLLTRQQVRDSIALMAARLDHEPGRRWRSLQDTTNGEIVNTRNAASGYRSWTRGLDYYAEGALIWLDADTLIRQQTGGKKSLDDFARAFFGIDDGSYVPVTYTFGDVVAALNAVLPHDWAGFLRRRLDGHGPGAPLDGIARGGWRLVYTDQPSALAKAQEALYKYTDFNYSIGLAVGKDDRLSDVRWDGPAFAAGLPTGATLVAVNGVPYDADVLQQAIRDAAAPGAGAIALLVKADNRYRTVSVDYHGGLRYPHLERVPGTPDLLDAVLTPRP
ncbi:MAG: M61 family metallopeptidase [Burkholderiales bacterium]|nr:M61 family metallopeptidase [Burkholderiales bacterium]